ncbi:MAG: hypothetical protein PVH55_10855, partial [Desulfobacterales bacterium]
MRKDITKNDVNMNLVQMIATRNLEEQCSKISEWLKHHYNLDVTGFFLKEPGKIRSHFFIETAPQNIAQDLQEMLHRMYQIVETENTVLLFTKKDEKLEPISIKKGLGSLEPIGMTIPLGVLGRSIGTLALVSDSKTIRDVIIEILGRPSFVPLISTLLDNAFSHELNSRKIRMLNLYQTVSSSMSYIGDLRELLTTITGIV